MKRFLAVIFIILLIPSLCYGWTWTKSWSSSDDGSSFGGSDIQNIQSDVSTQALTVSGTPAQGAIMYYSGSSWTSLAAGTSGQLLKTNGAGANPSWSTSGVITQVVNTQNGTLATGTTTMPADNTIPQNTEGDEYMTRAITPTSATNKLRIDVVFCGAASAGGANINVALFQDTTANALAAVSVIPEATANHSEVITFTHYMTSGTTSSTTFKVRAGPSSAATLSFNGNSGAQYFNGVFASSITITEIVP